MNYLLKYAKTTAFVAGILSVWAFAPWYTISAAVLAFAVLMWLLLEAKTRKNLFLTAYAFGFAHFAFGLSWVGNALLIEPEKFGWLYPIVLIAAGAFLGLFFALPAVLIPQRRKNWQKWLFFCAMVVVFEWIRSFIFTGFPWNLIGYTLAFSDEMIQIAAWGGSYLLSLVALLVYTVGGVWFARPVKKNLLYCTAFVGLVVGGVWSVGYLRIRNFTMDEGNIVVRIVQPSIPQKMKWDSQIAEDNFRDYLELSRANFQTKPDLIVWGETASPFRLDDDEKHLAEAVEIIPQGSYLIAGMITYRERNGWFVPHNSMVIIDDKGEIVDYYHKSHLVPFGEYIPFREYLPDFIKPVANAIGTFGRGNGPKKIVLDGLMSLGGVICYEIIFPHEVVNQEARPDFLVNLTNDGWYGNSAGPYQHWAATKMRAVEEGIEIIRAANNGISGVIDALGRDKNIMPLNHKGFLDVRLDKPLGYKNVYSRFGNGVILTFCLILVFLGVIKVERG